VAKILQRLHYFAAVSALRNKVKLKKKQKIKDASKGSARLAALNCLILANLSDVTNAEDETVRL
jgi:hypothetical protein